MREENREICKSGESVACDCRAAIYCSGSRVCDSLSMLLSPLLHLAVVGVVVVAFCCGCCCKLLRLLLHSDVVMAVAVLVTDC